jgi:hypothetical protein
LKPGPKCCSIEAPPSAIEIGDESAPDGQGRRFQRTDTRESRRPDTRQFGGSALVILLLLFGSGVHAQSDNRIALGANISLRDTADAGMRGRDGLGLLCRFGRGDTGWGWDWGLNWVSADITRHVGGSLVQLGEMHVRPVMVGYGYDYRRGRQLYFASVVAGYAFVSMALAPAAVDAYHDRLGARSVSVKTPNTLAVRPEIGVWHDLAEKVGVNVSASYLMARPLVTVRTATGDDDHHIRADMFQIKVGIVYSIF